MAVEGQERKGRRIWWWWLRGGRVADIIQYNIHRLQNEVFMFFSKVHVWLHISRVMSFATKMKSTFYVWPNLFKDISIFLCLTNFSRFIIKYIIPINIDLFIVKLVKLKIVKLKINYYFETEST
jgi:hypothetical protein